MALLAGPADVLRDQDRVNRAPHVFWRRFGQRVLLGGIQLGYDAAFRGFAEFGRLRRSRATGPSGGCVGLIR
jgi:hypothetical protein